MPRKFVRRYARRPRKTVSKAVKKYVRKALVRMPEHKYYITRYDSVPLGSIASPLFTGLSLIPQGVTDSERVGDECMQLGLDIRYTITADGASANAQQCRIMILQWHEPNFPGANNILYDTTAGQRSINSPTSWDDRSRFHLMYDKTHTVGAGNAALFGVSSIPTSLSRVFSRKVRHKRTQFFGGGTTVKNGLIVLMFCTSGTTPPLIQFDSRVRYIDA